MSFSRAQLDQIRAVNRARLGVAGLGAGFLSPDMLSGAVRRATVRTSFPSAEATWSPGGIRPEQQEGGWISQWAMAHVVRPEVDIDTPLGLVTVAPYRTEADWSTVARVAAIGAVGLGAFGVAWLIGRALS